MKYYKIEVREHRRSSEWIQMPGQFRLLKLAQKDSARFARWSVRIREFTVKSRIVR